MGKKVVVGGQRLGAGDKITQDLHNYEFTSFNLEQDFKSSMAPGVLYPFLKLVGTNHDTFDIDLESFMRTLPTRGPLFGAFKLQCDVFCVPMRLYQGVLHNNPVDIGLDMKHVFLPKIEISTIDNEVAETFKRAPRVLGSNDDDYQINTSSLEKYLGLSGIGKPAPITKNDKNDKKEVKAPVGTTVIFRKFQCIPELAYYDIFKNYYANKQEEKAYVITPKEVQRATSTLEKITINYHNESGEIIGDTLVGIAEDNAFEDYEMVISGEMYTYITIEGKNLDKELIQIYVPEDGYISLKRFENDSRAPFPKGNQVNINQDKTSMTIIIGEDYIDWYQQEGVSEITINANNASNLYTSDIYLRPFNLKNIDKMRAKLLACNELTEEFVIENQSGSGNPGVWQNGDGYDNTGMPYSALVKRTASTDITWNAFTMNGLCVKTYQSDIFNNWLDSEFIDGTDGINAITAVAVTDGSFTLDSLAMSKKVWTLLNRILMSGGTYEDWQEARYGEGAVRKAETPMYVGGMSGEIMFEEVVSNSETKVDGDFQPLGSLGGKGTQVTKNGGNKIHVKCDEPSYIIGICSLTPRICYSQGNDWDRTELDTMDDLHAPELDGIGFQDLIVERFAWWNTMINRTGGVGRRDSAGKQIAWLDYMTAYDKCYGDFAKPEGYAFMVLNRNYDHDESTSAYAVKDITTYIDPAKYNYAFAYTNLDAQNFWCRIHSKVVARRKMAGQQIPNL